MYEKPEVFVVMTDEEDIIRTSGETEGLINIGAGGGTGGDGEGDDVIDWNFY